ncbi:Uncharacterised protein [Bordetella pertussis]|uniref:Exported protein n=13 Tax=Bordetella pertussis TaxID=520 RepID=Q7VUI9_BORPE|nr:MULTISPECIES: DUF4148 domain-containing protein [Bordetella]ETH38106.1 PF13663 domain protein [Bordetella pertussis H918]ETH43867.1 PF13663 domain protein [Bordetella pertussis H939]ETH48277.1 PF13663 domain protein [Bordetella pertussis H921]ETH72472.1 PF13663 domain protein [Bordetella pertussis STO1-CHLA-0011]ETH81652.1 PF13663 domain protein [Bordetella pertussis STO1-CHOC-0017]ETH86645.1 PF13663 domain protein [Bordetella pertussis STO1-CHOC-0018]ETH92610.1 PF13663 domain protein [Bo
MRTFTSAALLAAALFGFNAFAGSGELDYPPAGAQGGSLTRSQVQHELAIARAAGQLVFGEAQEPAARPAGDAATRAQVQAELAQARDASAASEYVETGA